MDDEDDWTVGFELLMKLNSGVRSEGGLTAAERTALAKKFGVSEDLLIRYERARAVYNKEIFDNQRTQAGLEALRVVKAQGKDALSPEFGDELTKAFWRIEAAMPENKFLREFKEAKAAIKAALTAQASNKKE